MERSKVAGMMAATLLTVGPSALAQTPTQTIDTKTTQTFTGCLMGEPAYRKAHHLGSGALGGVGLGDEYVLVDVTTSPGTTTSTAAMKESAAKKEAAAAAAATSPGTCSDTGMAYRLTGPAEPKLKALLGRQIEVQGRFKDAKDVAEANGPAPGKLPAEVVIESFREAPAAATVETTPVQPPVTTTPVTPVPQPVTPPPPPATTPVTPPATTELPHTASSSEVLGVVGVISLLSFGLVSTWRRREI
jgi:LPXTG-motif cell wall-anchored protein